MGIENTNKVLENDIFDRATSAIGLDHHHLIGRPGVDITIENVANISVCPKRANGRATAPVTINVLNENVMCRALYDLV